jgi:hypothetical protein
MERLGWRNLAGRLGVSDASLAVLNSLLQLSRPLSLVLVPIRGLRRNHLEVLETLLPEHYGSKRENTRETDHLVTSS